MQTNETHNQRMVVVRGKEGSSKYQLVARTVSALNAELSSISDR